jgi:hypothetical protein
LLERATMDRRDEVRAQATAVLADVSVNWRPNGPPGVE